MLLYAKLKVNVTRASEGQAARLCSQLSPVPLDCVVRSETNTVRDASDTFVQQGRLNQLVSPQTQDASPKDSRHAPLAVGLKYPIVSRGLRLFRYIGVYAPADPLCTLVEPAARLREREAAGVEESSYVRKAGQLDGGDAFAGYFDEDCEFLWKRRRM